MRIFNIWITLLLFIISSDAINSQTFKYEKDYADYIQTLIGGEREVSFSGGRIDLVTDQYAIEVERADEWKEAIGQSLWYALNSNREPAIIIIREKKSENKYVIQLYSTLEYSGLADKIKVFIYPDDFRELMD